MSLVTHGFDLPIMPGSISPVLNLSQYDDARTFTAHLKDESGNPFTLPGSATAKLEGMNYKGVTFEINATPSGSDITFTPAEAATDQPGLIAATLHIKIGHENISTLAVILNVQKAGATKEEQARSPGFTDAIQNAVNAYFDGDPPFFELPSGGQSGQALLSDGVDGAVWGEAGIPEAVKTALLNAVMHIGAWSDNKGQDYYDALYESLYNAAPVPSRLPAEYQEVEWIGSSGTQLLLVGLSLSGSTPEAFEMEAEIAVPELNASTAILMGMNSEGGFYISNVQSGSAVGLGPSIVFSNLNVTQKHKYVLTWDASYGIATCEGQTIQRSRSALKTTNFSFFGDYEKLFLSKCRIYSAKVKQSGVYVRDLVPCYRKSDNVIGMYDVVGEAFYTNRGTGAFTKGADV